MNRADEEMEEEAEEREEEAKYEGRSMIQIRSRSREGRHSSCCWEAKGWLRTERVDSGSIASASCPFWGVFRALRHRRLGPENFRWPSLMKFVNFVFMSS